MRRCGITNLAASILLLALTLQNVTFAATDSTPAWKADDGIAVEGGGDPRKPGAASLILRTDCPEHDCIGSATWSLDAAGLRGMRLTWFADLKRTTGAKTASVWIGVDGKEAKKRLAFVTSFYAPVPEASDPVQREVSLIVPWNAETVVLGVLASGWGEVTASDLRLKAEEVRRSISRDEAVATVEEAIGIVRKHAWHPDTLDENRLHDVRDMARTARIPEEVEGAVRYLLAGLNDRHSQLRTSQQAADFREKSVPSAPPEVVLRADGIAYVRIPAITGANEEAGRKVAEDLMSRISDLSKQEARGWIVDLRSCSGGNMWPMLAGLMPLLGDGVLGYFRARDGEQTPWRAGEHLGAPRLASPVDSSKARVAVLIGPGTASSGEAVAVAFRGRPETRFFGQATYGVANSNQTFFLRDGSLLLLMTAIDVDRNGRAYGGKVMPDETNVGDNAEQAMQDAMHWLGQSTTREHGVTSQSKR